MPPPGGSSFPVGVVRQQRGPGGRFHPALHPQTPPLPHRAHRALGQGHIRRSIPGTSVFCFFLTYSTLNYSLPPTKCLGWSSNELRVLCVCFGRIRRSVSGAYARVRKERRRYFPRHFTLPKRFFFVSSATLFKPTVGNFRELFNTSLTRNSHSQPPTNQRTLFFCVDVQPSQVL